MELVIGLIVIGVLGYFAFFRKKEEVAEVAPYKVETPAPAPVVVEAPPAPVVAPLGDTTSGGGPGIDLTPAPAESNATGSKSFEELWNETQNVSLQPEPEPAKKPRKPRAPKVEATPVKAPAKAKAPAAKAKAPAAKAKATTTAQAPAKKAAAIVAKKPRAKKA